MAASISGIGLSLSAANSKFGKQSTVLQGKRIGIIGLDTSHSVAFTKSLNNHEVNDGFNGYRIVAAYPYGSRDIVSSTERIPGYIEEVSALGVEIVESIEKLLDRVDLVMLETNDGRLHLEQSIPVILARKPIFIDKPMSASLADAIVIFETARKHNVPVFSSSSLRYISGMDEIAAGKIGKIVGAETYSPAKLEKTHPDLFWYGIHGVETLFAAMGTGCKSVIRVSNQDTDLVIGTWMDGRIGTFRGIRKGKSDYGGTVFGENGISVLGSFDGYNPLLLQIIRFFQTGDAPVRPEETIEILAFMEAADLSKANNCTSVELETVMRRAMAEANDRNIL